MNSVIDEIFSNIDYWQDKNLLLNAIPYSCYQDKNTILKLLKVSSVHISEKNEAKKDMWNYQIIYNNMGDDILSNVSYEILADFNFTKTAISKYHRTYIFLNRTLRASEELAKLTVLNEQESTQDKYFPPILQHMPESFQKNPEIALVATTRNIENLRYAIDLRTNKYFIIDIMNSLSDNKIKQKILRFIDQDLLKDKIFIAKLGCFDNLCQNFHNDINYLVNAVSHDINILKKIKVFNEEILTAAINGDDFIQNRTKTIALIFRYIEKFNEDFSELNKNIKDKTLINKLFWLFGETISNELI